MRTIVDIPERDLRRLDAIARKQKVSRTEVVRKAVAEYATRQSEVEEFFGLWRGRGIDALAHQNALRDEWERDLSR